MTTSIVPKWRRWTSYALQGIVIIMFLMGAIFNLIMAEDAVKQSVEFGYQDHHVHYLGAVLLVSTLLYAIPRTAMVGAVLLSCWLGGAVATHAIHNDGLGSAVLPVIFGVIVWGALWLRKPSIVFRA